MNAAISACRFLKVEGSYMRVLLYTTTKAGWNISFAIKGTSAFICKEPRFDQVFELLGILGCSNSNCIAVTITEWCLVVPLSLIGSNANMQQGINTPESKEKTVYWFEFHVSKLLLEKGRYLMCIIRKYRKRNEEREFSKREYLLLFVQRAF